MLFSDTHKNNLWMVLIPKSQNYSLKLGPSCSRLEIDKENTEITDFKIGVFLVLTANISVLEVTYQRTITLSSFKAHYTASITLSLEFTLHIFFTDLLQAVDSFHKSYKLFTQWKNSPTFIWVRFCVHNRHSFTTPFTGPHLKPDKRNPHPHTLCPKFVFATGFTTITCKGRKGPHGDTSLS